MKPKTRKTIHDFKVHKINGQKINLKEYRSNLLLIVTVGSYDGHARQNLESISNLADLYHRKGLIVLLFPCIKYFNNLNRIKGLQQLLKEYNDKIILCELISINGSEQHPIIKYCLNNDPNPWADKMVAHNFTKFLVNKLGNVVGKYGPYELIENNKELLNYLDDKSENKTIKDFLKWVDMPEDVKKEYLYILTKNATD